MPEEKQGFEAPVDEQLEVTRTAIRRNADVVLRPQVVAHEKPADTDANQPVPAGPYLPRYYAGQLRGKLELRAVADLRRTLKMPFYGGDDNQLPENYIGGALGDAPLIHPKISTCIGLVCVLADRITGAHFTLGTQHLMVNAMLSRISSTLNEGRPVLAMYVFSPAGEWTKRDSWAETTIKWNGKGIMGAISDFKEKLAFNGQVSFFEQTFHTSCWYRSTLVRSGGTPSALVERAPDIVTPASKPGEAKPLDKPGDYVPITFKLV